MVRRSSNGGWLSHQPVSQAPPLKPDLTLVFWVACILVLLLPHSNPACLYVVAGKFGSVWRTRLPIRQAMFQRRWGPQSTLTSLPLWLVLLSTVKQELMNGMDPSVPIVGKCKARGPPTPEQHPVKTLGSSNGQLFVSLWTSGFGRQSKTHLAHQKSLGLTL